MADIKAQLLTKNGDNLYPVTSLSYVSAIYSGGISFDSATNTLTTSNIPIGSVSNLTLSLTAKQPKCSAGFRTEIISGATIAQKRYFDIASNHSAGALTLSAGLAYRIFATGSTVTLNAETFSTNQFGLEGHATILVTNNSLLTFGSNVVLGQPLVNDAVNNCTLRFHDGHCIIDVEDHAAAHTVTVATGTGSGTLYQYCSSAYSGDTTGTPTFISISDALDGALVSFNGVTINGERHIAGNGIERTSLTGSCKPNSKTYITHAAFSGLTVLSGGTVHATDTAVPAGASATFSSFINAYETLTVNGTLLTPGGFRPSNACVVSGVGTINLSSRCIVPEAGAVVTFDGVTLTGGTGGIGAIVAVSSSIVINFNNATVSGNANGSTPGITVSRSTLNVSDSIISGNKGNQDAYDITAPASTTININGGCLLGDISLGAATTSLCFTGINKVNFISGAVNATVNLSSGAVLDLTGNTNTTTVVPNISFAPGGATVYPSAGVAHAYSLESVKSALVVSSLRNDNVVNMNGSHIVVGSGDHLRISGCVLTNGDATSNGGAILGQAGGNIYLEDVTITGTTTAGNGGALFISKGCSFSAYHCTFSGLTARAGGALYLMTGAYLESCYIDDAQFTSTAAAGVWYLNSGHITISGCTIGGAAMFTGGGATNIVSYTFAGSNRITGGQNRSVYLTALISAGATINLTDNTNNNPLVAQKGLIVGYNNNGTFVASGSATVIASNGSIVTITGSGTSLSKAGVLA